MPKLSNYKIDNSSSVPKNEQLKVALMRYIARLPEDIEYLPYEYELESQFGVSRRTVRRALEKLRNAGMIETRRKCGSKILKRDSSALATKPPSNNLLKGTTVAAIIMSDQDRPERSNSLAWQITTELENDLAEFGANVAVYNMREQYWDSSQKLINSLTEKKIDWAFVDLCSLDDQEKLIADLMHAEIKLALFAIDLQQQISHSVIYQPGLDYVVLNNLSIIQSNLMEQFSDADFMAYLTNNCDNNWSAPRAQVCKNVAEKLNIPFKQITVPMATPHSDSKVQYFKVREDAAINAAMQLIPELKGKKYPLCIAANDFMAAGALSVFNEHDISVPSDIRLIGYDNYVEFRSLNISTFDFNPPAIAQAMVELYEYYLHDKAKSRQTTTGKMVFPKFIQRMTS